MGLWQGTRQGDRLYWVDEVVVDADASAACNIRDRLRDDGSTLWTPYREVKALLAERTRTTVGTAPPGRELQGRTNLFLSTESEVPKTPKVLRNRCEPERQIRSIPPYATEFSKAEKSAPLSTVDALITPAWVTTRRETPSLRSSARTS